MKYRKIRKAILAAVLAVPMAMSYPDPGIMAQDEPVMQEESVSEETEAEGVPEEDTSLEENPVSDQEEWELPGGSNLIIEDTPSDMEEQDSAFEDGFYASEETEGDAFFDGNAVELLEEDDFFMEGDTEDMIAAYIAPDNYVQEGSPVKNGSGGFTPVTIGETYFSSKYTRLGWNDDSQVYPWNNAGSNVYTGLRPGEEIDCPYFVPLNDTAKGKFGFRITHVGYNKETNTKLDLLLTETNYHNYTYDYTGKKIEGIYPMFGVGSSKELWIVFKDELAAQEIKIDIVKSGTNTPVPGNYRFRWLDIDLYQRFGIRLQNGTIAHRYATKDSVVNVVKKTQFSQNYEVLTAPAPEVKGEVPQNTVVYELDNSSGFYLAILRPGCGSHSIETEARIKKTFEATRTGKIKTSAGLNWDAKGYGPVEYPSLVKKTGNTLASQGNSNSISDSTGEFYYTLQTDIPEEHSAYYYSSCKVTDTLPAGVDYNGYAAVKMLPSETDVSSWFTISAAGDVLKFQATPAALAKAEFYGKTYEFQLKVKMDPTEITPVYSGDSYKYEVKNKASISCKHINGQEGTNWSNEVTTSCTRNKNRVPGTEVKKYTANLQENIWKTDLLLPNPDSTYQYKLSVKVPDNEYGGYMTKLELADTLPAGAEKTTDPIMIYENGKIRADNRFTVNIVGKKITVSATNAALGDRSFYGKSYDVIVTAKMVPEQISCTYNGTVASYAINNKYTITTRHKGDAKDTVLTSNNVADRASVSRTEPKNPEKWILDGEKRVASKIYEGRDFRTVFEIVQEIPSNKREWKIKGFKIQDTLENCFQLKSAQLYQGQTVLASFNANGGTQGAWSMTRNGSAITVGTTGELPDSCYGQEIRLVLTVDMKSDSDLQPYYVENADPNILEARIYNIATSSFDWIGGVPSSTSKNTEKTQVVVKENTPKGKLTIQKTDKSQNKLSGGVFQIIAAGDIRSASGNILLKSGAIADTVTTGENGTAVSEGLYLGKYVVKEIKPPAGYIISKESFEIQISKEEMEKTVLFQDEETLVLIKKISQKENAGDAQKVLGGVNFLLWEKTKSEDSGKTYTTGKDGQIKLTGIVPGTYQLKEIATPTGYVSDGNVYEFTVDENGLVEKEYGHTIVIENAYTKAEFLKTDRATGKAVAGAVLQLCDANGKVIDTWTSELTAHRINRLEAGEYVLSELRAPSGYKKGQSVNCIVKSLPEVQKFSISDVKLVTITVDKVLHGNEIVWAQGNPVFTFTVNGIDLDGEEHTYTNMVEFAKDNTDTRADVSKRIVFTLPAGTYKVKEEAAMRYKLEKIDQVVNGTVQDSQVEFKLTANQNGAAVFTNKKKDDRLLTDTGLVRNVVIPKN